MYTYIYIYIYSSLYIYIYIYTYTYTYAYTYTYRRYEAAGPNCSPPPDLARRRQAITSCTE